MTELNISVMWGSKLLFLVVLVTKVVDLHVLLYSLHFIACSIALAITTVGSLSASHFSTSGTSLYETLGLTKASTPEEVKKAYRKVSKSSSMFFAYMYLQQIIHS